MPDYNLGRAHGEVVITADTSGAERATAAMAASDAQAQVLNRTLGDTNKHLSAHEQSMKRTAEATQGYQQRVKELNESEDRLRKVLLDTKSTTEEIARARRNQASAARNAEEAEKALREEAEKSRSTFARLLAGMMDFGRGTGESRKHVQGLTSDLHAASSAADRLANTLTRTLGTALKITGGAAGVGIAGGALGLLGAGGASGGMNVIAGAVETIKDFSGAVALLPSLVGAAGVSVATLAVSLHGVGDALKAMDDPTAFAKALVNMAPAAQQAVRTIASFSNAYKSAGKEVQQAFFAPMLESIKPLILTWLPQLMNAGKQVAGAFGGLGKTLMQAFMQPEVISGFNTFITNLTASIKALEPAIKPFMQAFQTLGVVGSQSFGRLSETIVKVANGFNQFIQNAANTGQLTAWINRALDAFSSLWSVMKNIGSAFNNIMAIGDKFGGNFLNILVRITAEFDNWTKSTQGQSTLAAFFTSIQAAGQALSPVIKTIGADFAILITALAKLGTAMAPGFEAFFAGLGKAIQVLGNSFNASGNAFTVILAELGNLLVQLANSIGPQLPAIFTNLATALVDLAPSFVTVAGAITNFMSHITAGDIELVLGLVGALKVAVPVFTVLNAVMSANPIALVISALAALTVGVIYAYDHFKTFHDAVNSAFTVIKELVTGIGPALGDLGNAVASEFSKMVHSAEDWGKSLITNFINGIKSSLGPVGEAAAAVAQTVADFWHQKSPPKTGPIRDAGGTQEMGSNATTLFARGIESTSSQIDSATSAVAAEAAKGYGGISGVASSLGGQFLSPGTAAGGGSFSSGGQATTSRGRTQGAGGVAGGQSGFDQYISGLTQDLSAFNQIAKDSNNLFQQISGIVIQGMKITASLWNQGDNPLTQEGGFFNTPGQGPVAPLPELTPQHYAPGNTPATQQEAVPGVPQLGPNIPAPKGFAGVTGSVQGQAPPNAASNVVGAGDTPLVAALKANGSFSPEQIRMIQGFSEVEGKNPSGVPTLGFVDNQPGTVAGTDLKSHVQALANQFRDRASVAGAFPTGGTDQEQARWMAKVVGQNGSSSDWQGNAQPKDYVQRVVAAMAKTPQGGGIAANAAAPTGFTPQPYGLPKGTNTGGYGSPEANNIFPQWLLDLGAQYGVKPSTYGKHQESDRGGEPGYAPNPEHQNRGVDWVGSRADMERFAKALTEYGGANPQGGLEQVIYQAGPGGTKYGLGGAGNVNPGYYPQSGDGSYDEHGGTDNGAHVHTRFSASVPSYLNNPPPAQVQGDAGANSSLAQVIPPVAGLPAGNSQELLPGGLLGATVLGGPAVAAGALGFRRYLNRRTPKPVAGEPLRGFNLDLGERPTGGLNIELGPTPGGDFAKLSPAEQLQVARDLQNYRGTGRAGGITGGASQSAIDLYNRLGGGAGATPGSYADRYGGSRGRYNALSPEDKARVQSLFNSSGPLDRDALDKLLYDDNARGAYGTYPGEIGNGRSLDFKPPPGVGSRIANVLGPAVDAVGIQGVLNQTQQAIQSAPRGARGPMTAGTLAVIPTTAVAAGQAATSLALPAVAGISSIGALGLGAISTATGPLSGQEPRVDYTRRQFTAQDAQGRPLQVGRPPTGTQSVVGDAGATTALRRSSGWFGSQTVGTAGSTAPVDVNIAATNGVKLSGKDIPIGNGANAPVPGMTRAGPTLPQNPAVEPTNVKPGAVQGMTRAGPTLPQNPLAEPTAAGQSEQQGIANPAGLSTANTLGSALTSAGSIAGDVFQVFDDVIKSIGAAANITDQLVRGFANTEDVVGVIQQAQQFITTAADIAKLVSDTAGTVGQFVGAGAAADPSGSTAGVAAAFGAVSAISGLVGQVLQAVNASISLGIEVYHQATKIQANIEGFTLGNSQTGQLAGNVQMLLNTQTGQVSAYSDSNPQNKAIHDLPSWFARSYGGNRPATSVVNNNQLVAYVGPGQTPMQMMSDTMWLVGTGAPSVASVAGRD